MFRTGMENWIARGARAARKARVGLVSHSAAVDARGRPTLDLLCRAGVRPVAIFGPEHGYAATAAAGAAVGERRHARLRIPVHSLYGETRTPPKAWLENLDLLLIDLQDLGVRCYTYLSTLRNVLTAASGSGLKVVVTDRPVPFPNVVDGPMLDERFESFVAGVPAPFVTGMTQAEAARWMVRVLRLDVDLETAPMTGYARSPRRGAGWPAWRNPSPAIRSWTGATAYPATVWAEALPALDCCRSGALAFQVLGAPGLPATEWTRRLRVSSCEGVEFRSVRFRSRNRVCDGVRLIVRQPDAFRPAHCAAVLLTTVQALLGPDALWASPGSRPEFFDQLAGTNAFRKDLLSGLAPERIAAAWRKARAGYVHDREDALLYAPRRPQA
jgi:uncharacterized protein YbbC (DUF1343 family)